MSRDFPELHDFFGAYFHQDWTVEHDTAEKVIDAFLAESDFEDLVAVQRELYVLLDQNKNELALREYLLTELSCYYSYLNVWESGESWLRHIAEKLARRLDRHSH